MRRLIITADDFGLALPVNEAVEQAHRDGVLTCASLMVSAPATKDAIERARRLPSLKVGLHLVVVEGRPVLPPDAVPDLVDANGEFSRELFVAGVRCFFLPRVRKQLENEIRAQFEAFRKTGLPLDHVNAHNHMHLHPTILGLILKVGKGHGIQAVRVPDEPPRYSIRTPDRHLIPSLASRALLLPWLTLLRRRLHQHGVRSNDFVFGLSDTGAMDTRRVLEVLRHLPAGVTEMYFHPSTSRCPELLRDMADYHHEAEFQALISPEVKQAIASAGAQLLAYSDLMGPLDPVGPVAKKEKEKCSVS